MKGKLRPDYAPQFDKYYPKEMPPIEELRKTDPYELTAEEFFEAYMSLKGRIFNALMFLKRYNDNDFIHYKSNLKKAQEILGILEKRKIKGLTLPKEYVISQIRGIQKNLLNKKSETELTPTAWEIRMAIEKLWRDIEEKNYGFKIVFKKNRLVKVSLDNKQKGIKEETGSGEEIKVDLSSVNGQTSGERKSSEQKLVAFLKNKLDTEKEDVSVAEEKAFGMIIDFLQSSTADVALPTDNNADSTNTGGVESNVSLLEGNSSKPIEEANGNGTFEKLSIEDKISSYWQELKEEEEKKFWEEIKALLEKAKVKPDYKKLFGYTGYEKFKLLFILAFSHKPDLGYTDNKEETEQLKKALGFEKNVTQEFSDFIRGVGSQADDGIKRVPAINNLAKKLGFIKTE